MSDGSISQDEIDALLAGVDMGGMGAASAAPSQKMNESQNSALTRFLSENMDGIKSNLGSMTGKSVEIGEPQIEIMKRDNFLRKIPEMVAACVIDFNSALVGDHLFVLAPEFAQKIVSLVNNEANAELDEMSLSVISETVSQHVGIELTSLEKAGFKGVANNPAETVHVPKAMVRFPQADFTVFTWPITLDGSAFSLWEIIPSSLASDIANAFGGAQDTGMESLGAADGMAGMGAMQGGMNAMQGMGAMQGGMNAMQGMGMQGGGMGMNAMQGGMQNMGGMPNMGMNGMQGMGGMNMGNMGMQGGMNMGGNIGQVMGMNPNVQSVQFPNLQLNTAGMEQGNIGLIMDVYMEMTVELGRTKKVIKEILGMGEGTIIELDKLAGEPVDILVNHKPIAKGEVVVIDENFGVRVTEILSPIERVSEM
jgi:flagellar motor switch protein FliN